MAKRQITDFISEDLKTVAADSFADNIRMLDVSEIMPSLENFYEMSDLELLADDIEREGLKHNLVVSKDKNSEKYWLKSGHRRLEAIKFLINEGRLKSTKVPCLVDGEKTKAENMLDLIMLNATQRKYTDVEMMREYEQLTETLKALDAEGKGLKGRLRENIARILNVSKSQVGKMDYIKNNAVPELEQAVKDGEISISTAHEVAKLSPEQQREIVAEKPDITSNEAKEIKAQNNSKAAQDFSDTTDSGEDSADYEDITAESDEGEDEDISETKSPAPTISSKKSCTLSGEETAVLAKYIDDIFSLCSDEDERVLEKIRAKLDNC